MMKRMLVGILVFLCAGTSLAAAQGDELPVDSSGKKRALSTTASPIPAKKVWLGLRLRASQGGARIAEVIKDTPAFDAGLRIDDQILQVANRVVSSPSDVSARVQRFSVGERISLQVRRKDSVFKVRVPVSTAVSDAELLRRRLLGEPAADFDLPLASETQGRRFSLKQRKGQVVVLEFWATWCQNCASVHRALNTALAESSSPSRGKFAVLSLASETPDLIEKYLRTHRLDYPVLFDRYANVRAAYHAPSLPTLVVVDRAGIVRFAGAGAGENTEKAIAVAQRLARQD